MAPNRMVNNRYFISFITSIKNKNMGNVNNTQLQFCSPFDDAEIARLGRRFNRLDANGNGSLSPDELMQIPELARNPLLKRFIDVFDANKNGEIDFKEFIRGVSQFNVNTDRETKLRFAFQIYDTDNDGYISNSDFFRVMKMMAGSALTDSQIQQIVDRTIIDADRNGNGKINFKEFCQCFNA